MSLDTDIARLVLQVATMVGALGAAVYTWFVARNKQTQRQIDELAEISKAQTQRIQALENDNRHAPTHSDIRELTQQVSTLHGDLREMSGRLTTMNTTVQTMHRHLMNQSD